MKIIAVDFDGTIAKTRYPYIVELIPESSYIVKWRRAGHKVVLWTCRMGEPLEMALAFCKQNGLVFDGINENVQTKYDDDPRKISAEYYIDDKCPMDVAEQWYAVDSLLGNKPVKRTVTKQVTVKTILKSSGRIHPRR
jgi:hydroxymethylpyrimidine pyrophosphatase-like HAD family hydrolase